MTSSISSGLEGSTTSSGWESSLGSRPAAPRPPPRQLDAARQQRSLAAAVTVRQQFSQLLAEHFDAAGALGGEAARTCWVLRAPSRRRSTPAGVAQLLVCDLPASWQVRSLHSLTFLTAGRVTVLSPCRCFCAPQLCRQYRRWPERSAANTARRRQQGYQGRRPALPRRDAPQAHAEVRFSARQHLLLAESAGQQLEACIREGACTRARPLEPMHTSARRPALLPHSPSAASPNPNPGLRATSGR